MAAVHQTQAASCHQTQAASCHMNQRASPECSIVVDDVDEKCLRVGISTTMTVTNDERNSPSPEYTTNRIKEFQRVAEGRKKEFARLLEEHAQVIRRLKQMEETDADAATTASSHSA